MYVVIEFIHFFGINSSHKMSHSSKLLWLWKILLYTTEALKTANVVSTSLVPRPQAVFIIYSSIFAAWELRKLGQWTLPCKEATCCYLNPLLPLPKDTSSKKYYSDTENNNNTLLLVFTFLCLWVHGDGSCLSKIAHTNSCKTANIGSLRNQWATQIYQDFNNVSACVFPIFASCHVAITGKGYKLWVQPNHFC